MVNFHGEGKHSAFFEGWYLRHQRGEEALALIPAFHVDAMGRRTASVQLITPAGSDTVSFPGAAFSAEKSRFALTLGENHFSPEGLAVDLQGAHLKVRGRLEYGPFASPKTDLMGPFSLLPFLQCNHGVVSFAHRLTGELWVNDRPLDFTGGTGYIEKDWGSSFPSSYLWTQCGWFDGQRCCVMLSLADIPFLGRSFTGCIASVWYGGREYRLATYRGVRLLCCTGEKVLLAQGPYRLEIRPLAQRPHPLQAPVQGGMTRIIRESLCCTVSYRFWAKGRLLFDFTSPHASFEAVPGQE